MYTLLVIFAGFTIVSATIEECMKLAGDEVNVNCCVEPIIENVTTKPSDERFNKELIEECLRPGSTRCDTDTCIGHKKGYLNEKGQINSTAIAVELKKQLGSAPLYERVKTACIDIYVYKRTPPKTCVMQIINQCAQLHFFLGCTKWSNDKDCWKLMKLAKKCNSPRRRL